MEKQTKINFALLWLAMLVSSTGTFLLLLALSTKYYLEFKSGVFAGGVFSSQWLASLILFPLISTFCLKYSPRNLLSSVEGFSAIASLLIGLFSYESWGIVFSLLFLRGFLEGIMKSSRMMALKLYIPKDHIEKASSMFNTSYFIGAGIGGLIGTFVINRFSLMQIASIDALTFIMSASIYLSLIHI